MSMDDGEEPKGSSGAEESGAKPAASSNEEEEAGRVNAAKAFFRAMYAGEEPPAAFGAAAEQTGQPAGQATACRNCEGLEFSVREAEQKAAEAESLYKRMAADFENYRRRMEREREEAVSMGVKKAAEAFIPALDDLDRAISFLTPETPAEKLIESFQLVSNRIFSCLEQIGLKSMKSVGEPFDPKFHEPVQQVETTEFPDGHVMQELRRGYLLSEKVVRPALVNVASNESGAVTALKKEAGSSSDDSTADKQPDSESSTDAEVVNESSPASDSGNSGDSNPAEGEPVKVYDLGDTDNA
jgi:molecular chaperone GrpE